MPSTLDQFIEFRKKMAGLFSERQRAIVNLVDSICSDDRAKSPVQLSLSPAFEGHYSNITKAIDSFVPNEKGYRQLAVPYIKKVFDSQFYLMAVDVTPYERKFSNTMEDRTFIHKPNTVKGKPVSVGHDFSTVVSIPLEGKESPPWVVPLDSRRVKSSEIGHVVGMEQVLSLAADKDLPFHDHLTVCLSDCAYSCPKSLKTITPQLDKNLVAGVRIKNNRVAYKRNTEKQVKAGHPKWYGDQVKLNDPHNQMDCDMKLDFLDETKRGKTIKTMVSIWQDMIFVGSKDFISFDYPCTLVKIVSLNHKGKPIYKRPLWVAFYGHRRDEVLPFSQGLLYANRFKIEHFFRFIKRNFLMNDFQTPDLVHEESWNHIQNLAYLQLYAVKELATEIFYPWEVYLPKKPNIEDLGPKKIQRDFYRILKSLPRVTPPLIPRGRPPGRPKGFRPDQRAKRDIIVKKKAPAIEHKAEIVPPLEKMFDSKIKNETIKDPVNKREIITPDFEKPGKTPKPRSYYQPPLLPNLIRDKPNNSALRPP
jgi:hypothetical protein